MGLDRQADDELGRLMGSHELGEPRQLVTGPRDRRERAGAEGAGLGDGDPDPARAEVDAEDRGHGLVEPWLPLGRAVPPGGVASIVSETRLVSLGIVVTQSGQSVISTSP